MEKPSARRVKLAELSMHRPTAPLLHASLLLLLFERALAWGVPEIRSFFQSLFKQAWSSATSASLAEVRSYSSVVLMHMVRALMALALVTVTCRVAPSSMRLLQQRPHRQVLRELDRRLQPDARDRATVFWIGLVTMVVALVLVLVQGAPLRGLLGLACNQYPSFAIPLIRQWLWSLAAMLALVGAIGWVLQRSHWKLKLMMTRTEADEERKSTEMSPLVKRQQARLRQTRRSLVLREERHLVVADAHHVAVIERGEDDIHRLVFVASGLKAREIEIQAASRELSVWFEPELLSTLSSYPLGTSLSDAQVESLRPEHHAQANR